MLIDANLLLYAVDEGSPHYERASEWLTESLNGDRRVAFPWQTIGAFVRISTHPRIAANPLGPEYAWGYIDSWLDRPVAWIPPTTKSTAAILGGIIGTTAVTGNLIPDAQLAALAIEHGLVVHSADTDFARFTDVRWVNPLQV